MSSEVKLAPCPWSHLGGVHSQIIRRHSGYVYVECNCGARGPGGFNSAMAITAWNTRQPSPALSVAVEALERISRNGNKEEIAKVLVSIATDTLAKIKGEVGE